MTRKIIDPLKDLGISILIHIIFNPRNSKNYTLTLEKDRYFTYFTAKEDPHIKFKIHNLEYPTIKEGVHFGAKAMRGEEVKFYGKYSKLFNTTLGTIISKRNMGIVATKKRLETIATQEYLNENRVRLLAPIYMMLEFQLSKVSFGSSDE